MSESLEKQEMRAVLARAKVLVGLLTVRQVISAGNDAINAAGLNPWCMNEGRATGDERIGTWWMDVIPAAPPEPPTVPAPKGEEGK